MTIASVRRVAEKNERRAARLSKSADHKAKAHAAKRLRSPETRGGVHAFHARRRALDVPYDPGMDAASRSRPEGLWAEADARAEAELLAGREEASAAARRERKDRQREDRVGVQALRGVQVRAAGGL